MGLEQFDRFRATFEPVRTDDLTPRSVDWIGWTGVWQAAWVIEEGPYEGQFACTVYDRGPDSPQADAFAWVPECDLNLLDPA